MRKNTSFQQPIAILVVEDSPTDADLTIKALQRGRPENHIYHVPDGIAAMAFLRKEGKYKDAVLPGVVLLDLNMPRKDGREVLREIRADPALKTLVVIVLTTSDDEKDVLDAYSLNANAYIVKPIDLQQFFLIIHDLDQFWFDWVTLPPGNDTRNP
jgi:CheY-like chemotaxis protein